MDDSFLGAAGAQEEERVFDSSQSLADLLKRVPAEKQEGFMLKLFSLLEEQDSEGRLEKLTEESARKQFFKAIYDRDYDLVELLLSGSRRKYVNSNLICPTDRWTALHACLYKYNQYPPEETLRIVQLLIDHNADVNQPCPDGAVAINVLDKKPLANGAQNGPDNPNREKKTVSFQNKMVLDVAIDFLQAYKWAGCRHSVLQNWKPLIELLDKASMIQKKKLKKEHDDKYTVREPKMIAVHHNYSRKFLKMLEAGLGSDCRISVRYHDEEASFEAHRAVLMTSSPVFEKMFKHDMIESKTSEIDITDISPESVRLMLHYMYCGVILEAPIAENIELGLAVLCLTDKYDITDLKEHLEYFLHTLISSTNALRVLIAAHTYNAVQLRKVALNYVCDNFQTLSQCPSFDDFESKYPVLLKEILGIVTRALRRPHHHPHHHHHHSSSLRHRSPFSTKFQSHKMDTTSATAFMVGGTTEPRVIESLDDDGL